MFHYFLVYQKSFSRNSLSNKISRCRQFFGYDEKGELLLFDLNDLICEVMFNLLLNGYVPFGSYWNKNLSLSLHDSNN